MKHRIRFKKNSLTKETMYEGTPYEFTHIGVGRGFSINIKHCPEWDKAKEGELLTADVNIPTELSIGALSYVEYWNGKYWHIAN